MVKRWSNVKLLCSAKQATIIFKWLSRFWLAMVIIFVERGSQIHGISWQLPMYIECCVNKSKLLRYVRRIATETREKTWKLLFGPAFYSKQGKNISKLPVLCLFQLNIGQVMWRILKYTCSSLYWNWRRLSDICIFNVLWKALASLTIIYTKKFLQESVDHPSTIQPPEAESIWRFRTWWKLIIFRKYFYVNEIHVFEI